MVNKLCPKSVFYAFTTAAGGFHFRFQTEVGRGQMAASGKWGQVWLLFIILVHLAPVPLLKSISWKMGPILTKNKLVNKMIDHSTEQCEVTRKGPAKLCKRLCPLPVFGLIPYHLHLYSVYCWRTKLYSGVLFLVTAVPLGKVISSYPHPQFRSGRHSIPSRHSIADYELAVCQTSVH